jgi:hypothetical protein
VVYLVVQGRAGKGKNEEEVTGDEDEEDFAVTPEMLARLVLHKYPQNRVEAFQFILS